MMRLKVLLVTEKCCPAAHQRDGGARVVETIRGGFGEALSIMQFGEGGEGIATWKYDYPDKHPNRFERRIANAPFIMEKVKAVEDEFTHIIFVHVSMQFGCVSNPLRRGIEIWTFPMFLTPSYHASGEHVPNKYTIYEKQVLRETPKILTPSLLEKEQLIRFYGVPKERVHVVPRGVDTSMLLPKQRHYDMHPKFCSVGSIKPQKDTVRLVRLFAKIRKRFPTATLDLVGPVQNNAYFKYVLQVIQENRLEDVIKIRGHVPPEQMGSILEEKHIHLSTATYETFGRAIFETLASGLPNIAMRQGNASAQFLEGNPYIRFVDSDQEAVEQIQGVMESLPRLSKMAMEVGELYSDTRLSRLMIAKICNKDLLAVSDFDGTLFHKDDPEKTKRFIQAFKRFPKKVVCSARPLNFILKTLLLFQLEVDWIISFSGGVITDGAGKVLYLNSIKGNQWGSLAKDGIPLRPIKFKSSLLQLATEADVTAHCVNFRKEVYQGETFFSDWNASKFRAIHQLLDKINWEGRVTVFGDGIYDREMITYFDGTWITNQSNEKDMKYV